MIAEYRKSNPEISEGKLNWEIAKFSFTWVDDGKNDMLGVTISNEKTGEVNEIKSPPSK